MNNIIKSLGIAAAVLFILQNLSVAQAGSLTGAQCDTVSSVRDEICVDIEHKKQILEDAGVFISRYGIGIYEIEAEAKKSGAEYAKYRGEWEGTVSKTVDLGNGITANLFTNSWRGHVYYASKEVNEHTDNFEDGYYFEHKADLNFVFGGCTLYVEGDTGNSVITSEYSKALRKNHHLDYYRTGPKNEELRYKLVNLHPVSEHDLKKPLEDLMISAGKELIGKFASKCGVSVGAESVSTSKNSPSHSSPETAPINEKVVKGLVVSSFEPESIMAGEGTLDPLSGFVHYETLAKPLLIEGKNLQGLTISSDNIGLDGEPGVTFSDIQVSGDGTVATGYIKSRGTAMDGQTTVTTRNSAGRSVTREIRVDITGTQYLKRTFGETVSFLGDWTDVVPNAHITDLENTLKNGLKYTTAIGYLKLRILPTVYEEGVWHLSPCPPDTQTTAISGCASPGNKIIHLRDDPAEITPTIFHEAVHKLDFWHRGQYRGTPNAPVSPDGFFGSWVTVAARPEGYPPCQFLPLLDNVTWKDGTSEVPHCGFIVAYGASDSGDGGLVMAVGANNNPVNLVGYYEDVATMTESRIFNPALFNLPEVSTDPRYNKKINLLKQYVFFP